MDGITQTWRGGEHLFLLRIGQLRALQDKCDAGPEWILERLATKKWRTEDVLQTIRLGLEGGGLGSQDARNLVEEHIEQRNAWLDHVGLAATILMHTLLADSGEPVGESPVGARDQNKTRSHAENGDGPRSTARRLQ